MSARSAIYFTPRKNSALEKFGISWLGRDHRDAKDMHPVQWGIDPVLQQRITASPRFYGFHATIKAPFTLKDDVNLEELKTELESFASSRSAFSLQLKLANIGGFIALVSETQNKPLNELASSVVKNFEHFRAPLSKEDLLRKQKSCKNDRQRRYLELFGYPYVFEEFQFHMTLTERLEDSHFNEVWSCLENATDELTCQPFLFHGLALYQQNSRDTPFRMIFEASLSA